MENTKWHDQIHCMTCCDSAGCLDFVRCGQNFCSIRSKLEAWGQGQDLQECFGAERKQSQRHFLKVNQAHKIQISIEQIHNVALVNGRNISASRSTVSDCTSACRNWHTSPDMMQRLHT